MLARQRRTFDAKPQWLANDIEHGSYIVSIKRRGSLGEKRQMSHPVHTLDQVSGTKNRRVNNPLTFGHHQVPSQRLEITCLILCIPNVCYQFQMKWLQERLLSILALSGSAALTPE